MRFAPGWGSRRTRKNGDYLPEELWSEAAGLARRLGVNLASAPSLAVPFLVGQVDSRRMMAGSLAVALGAGVLLALQDLLRPDSAMAITALMGLETVGIVWPMAATHSLVFAAQPLASKTSYDWAVAVVDGNGNQAAASASFTTP